MVPETVTVEEKQPLTNDVKIREIERKSSKIDDVPAPNIPSCEGSLFEPHTFGYPSFFEDHFKVVGRQPHFSHPIRMVINDNCCNDNKLMDTLASDYQCIDDIIVPQENLFCQ